ncbi:hypothetical protein KOI35_41270 [Actinoplanes bogorensis]|uniref:Uncharacterized protein n=1 Tax=Paractinoplanes bogorensis TaxID=1610840 RepID=A0ABS5Z2N7_9ACTN|nr:hypothetical protein [Actinoplanes bogorensis]MBU2669959.1 hypothetical protein [Actinoplanes bogorensis]
MVAQSRSDAKPVDAKGVDDGGPKGTFTVTQERSHTVAQSRGRAVPVAQTRVVIQSRSHAKPVDAKGVDEAVRKETFAVTQERSHTVEQERSHAVAQSRSRAVVCLPGRGVTRRRSTLAVWMKVVRKGTFAVAVGCPGTPVGMAAASVGAGHPLGDHPRVDFWSLRPRVGGTGRIERNAFSALHFDDHGERVPRWASTCPARRSLRSRVSGTGRIEVEWPRHVARRDRPRSGPVSLGRASDSGARQR